MALQFILGAASGDHRAVIIQDIQAKLQADPATQVFYLVPNHIKFESEVSLLQGLRANSGQTDDTYAQSRVQVLSFSRLAWFFLKNEPVYQQPRLDRASNTMLVAKLLQTHTSELRVYAGEVSRPGFIAQLADQLSELQLGRITGQALDGIVQQLPPKDRRLPKMQDLALLLHAYEEAVGPYVTTPSLLTALEAKLASLDLSHTAFVLNHFNELAASELSLVEALMQHGESVTVALTLDKPAVAAAPTPPALFLPAGKLYHQLYQIAKKDQVPVRLDQYAKPRELSPAVQGVEAFFKTNTELTDDQLAPVTKNLTLARAADAYTELRTVASDITRKVHKGAHYRDFLVIARHLDPYRDVIDPIFAEYDLPVFTDLEHPMAHHPLVNLIDALFAVQRGHYQYADIMRLLRTELLIPSNMTTTSFRSAVDVVDNHLLRTDLKGSRWTDGKPWQYFRRRATDEDDNTVDPDAEKTAQINQIREFIAASLPPLYQALESAKSPRAAASALYHWLVDHGVVNQLTAWRQQAIDAGDLATSQADEQAWQTFVDLLDDYVTTMAGTDFALDQFAALLAAGFSGATYTQIPSTLDQVTVSETALTRLPRFKYVYVIGATSLVMPDVPKDNRVLTSEDRQLLSQKLPETSFLPLQGPSSTLGDPFINYLGMMAADTGVTLSYPVYGERENNASPYLTQMATLLDVTIQNWQGASLATSVGKLAGTARSLLSDYVVVARQAKDKNDTTDAGPGPAWQAVLAAIKKQPQWRDLAVHLAASVDYTNNVGTLAPQLATKLYGDHLAVSVSRLETYYRNPYEYFLRYGLRLSKRPEFELTVADSGSLYHAVMDQYLRQLKHEGKQLTEMDAAAIQQGVQALIAEFATEPGYEILTSSHSMAYATDRITAMLTDVLLTIREQQRRSHFRPQQTELLFGQIGAKHGLPALVLPVGNRQSVTVRGKIDRLDTTEVDGQTYYVVVDYKSSAHQFKPAEAYHGVALQMLTYLDAVQNATADAQPAGALYFHLYDPTVDYSHDHDAPARQFKQYKMYGLLVLPEQEAAAKQLATQFDTTLSAAPQVSPIVQLGLKKDGSFNANSTKVITPTMLDRWLNHNRHKIVEAATDIMTGHIDLAPIQFHQEATVITQSDFQAIMAFDPATGLDEYHHVSSPTPEALAMSLKEETENGPIHPEPTSRDHA